MTEPLDGKCAYGSVGAIERAVAGVDALVQRFREAIRERDYERRCHADALRELERRNLRESVARPRIVCLCGSTRFWETFRDEGLRLTLAGEIVLSIGIHAPDSMVFAHPDTPVGKEQKRQLDVLHRHKIDLADYVRVLNVGGYIGDSTRSEVAHALMRGKPIEWLEERCKEETR